MTRGTTDDRTELVVLCAEDGTPTGTAPKASVHTTATPLHRAFSVHLLDDDGRTLLTRRALGKAAWPGVWSNSCCGHPGPGEDDEDAVRRRVRQELGAPVRDVRPALPDFAYRATDASGVVEHEVCPVFTARVDPRDVRPDPAEVAETSWVPWADAVAAMAAAPAAFSPWAVLQTAALGPALPGTFEEQPAAATTLAAVDSTLARVAETLAHRWETFLPDDAGLGATGVDVAGWAGALVAGGKRLRPQMGHWGFVATPRAGGGHAHLVTAMAALELLHTFALVHDDLMDGSDRRRGERTTHVRAAGLHAAAGARGSSTDLGRDVAVLVGDLLHAEADRLVAGLPDSLRTEWDELVVELIAGQTADILGTAWGRTDLAHAARVADLKSGGYTVTRPLRLGAVAAGAGPRTLAALDAYARRAGRAFALRDDLLGVWGDPAQTGKPAGDDLRDGKTTVIRALAQQRLTGADARVLARVGTGSLTGDDVEHLRAALEDAGVRDAVEDLVAEEVTAARAALDDPHLTADGREGLLRLTDRLAWRTA